MISRQVFRERGNYRVADNCGACLIKNNKLLSRKRLIEEVLSGQHGQTTDGAPTRLVVKQQDRSAADRMDPRRIFGIVLRPRNIREETFSEELAANRPDALCSLNDCLGPKLWQRKAEQKGFRPVPGRCSV